MLQPQSKFSLKYLFILILCSGLLPILTLPTQGASSPFRPFLLISHVDTIPASGKKDTATKQAKVDTLNLKLSADSITSPVDHKAEDSMILEVDARKMLLYGKTEIKYDDLQVNAPTIVFDQQSQYVTAKMGRDTAGIVTGMAKMKQGETITVSDSLRFNFKSQKGLAIEGIALGL